MKIGNIEIYSVSDGFFRLDGGAMFGRVPKEIWKKTNPADRKNRILLALRCLLVKTAKRNILINTGIGDKNDKKFIQRFAIKRKPGLINVLAQYGLLPEHIDIVINTHLHWDHCGGNTKKEGDRVVPVFPNAKYLIHEGEWIAGHSDNILTRASYHKDDFAPLLDYGLVEFVSRDVFELEPSITLFRTGGHTEDHMIIRIRADGQLIFYLSDLIPTASHLSYPFIMAYDVEPMKTLFEKEELIPYFAENQSLLIFEHEPKFDAAYIKIQDKKIIAKEINL